MNKKQRNRKLVLQNLRNRLINRHYSSTIKTLSKIFLKQIKEIFAKTEGQATKQELDQTQGIRNKLYSAIDKAVKKGVIHKNTASRKKSRVHSIYQKVKY